ncbi:MAG: PepSY-associated TM helix domain-containing protein [Bacteroidales bacterium]|nr:PepSY-associated TM helix domain-containing protein [Bacteroidales bacterium]MBN2697226.1 PepSY-associated TM helix domain-containing protein [Bacteroidales bacterium]
MNWRKWNRWLHRELGYVFFGMTIIYGLSGIALNHYVARHWTPDTVIRSEQFEVNPGLTKKSVDKEVIRDILEQVGETDNYKQYYFPSDRELMIYLKGGHITLNLKTGKGLLVKVRNRPVFREVNYLHYNKPKQLWTWFSDLYAVSLILLAVSGLFIVRGKNSITRRGGILTLIGILIPLIFLAIYLWF